MKNPAVYVPILHEELKPLMMYLKKHHPPLAEWFENELQEKIKAS